MDSATFLNEIFRDEIEDGRQLVIWTAPDKASGFFEDAAEAAEYAAGKAENQNVYFGLGLLSKRPEKGRGTAADVSAIGCLWADIDVLHPAHKKKNLPPDIKAAQSILDRVGLSPSIVVHSGHGLQAYWLLKELWVIESAEERKRVEKLARRWVATVRAVADMKGFDCDSVGDLSRVFRLPGTVNRKDPIHPADVTVIESNTGNQYIPDDFDPHLVAEEYEPGRQNNAAMPSVKVGAITLATDAEPPALKLLAMLENDVKFKRAWKRNRPDLQDQSPSAYDMSLATLAAGAGWSDQEITDLIIASRRINGDDLVKAMRRDYIQRTIGKARTGVQQETAISDLADTATQMASRPPESDEEVEDQRNELLKKLSVMLGVPIYRWVQHGRENARYSLLLGDKRWVRMGSVEHILSASKFRAKVYEATGRLITKVKQKEWDDICKCLAACTEYVENEEATSAYQAEQWLVEYLKDHNALPEDQWQEAAAINEPFVRESQLYIHAGELRKHMRVNQREHTVTHVELCDCLKASGFSRVSLSVRQDSSVLRRSYWATRHVGRFLNRPPEAPLKKSRPVHDDIPI